MPILLLGYWYSLYRPSRGVLGVFVPPSLFPSPPPISHCTPRPLRMSHDGPPSITLDLFSPFFSSHQLALVRYLFVYHYLSRLASIHPSIVVHLFTEVVLSLVPLHQVFFFVESSICPVCYFVSLAVYHQIVLALCIVYSSKHLILNSWGFGPLIVETDLLWVVF